MIGEIHENERRFLKAINAYEKVLEIEPENK